MKISRKPRLPLLGDHDGDANSRALTSPLKPQTFNFMLALPGRASSPHTARAYYRWVDEYLVAVCGLQPTQGAQRLARMQALSIAMLQQCLTAPQLRAWLGSLVRAGHGRQGIDQARAAICTLASLVAESGIIRDETSAAMHNVHPPKAEDGQRTGRWLSVEQIHLLMHAARQIANSEAQMIRNQVVMTILCTMALRREELATARWGDLSLQDNRPVLRVHGKGRRVAVIDIPRPVMQALNTWRRLSAPEAASRPPAESALVRRIWKGGRVSKYGLTPDGIWLIVSESARAAGLGEVAPHDLRRSVAGALQESGVSIDKISRLLRHANVAVTERYLSKLPKVNEGAILMSDVLGLETDLDLD